MAGAAQTIGWILTIDDSDLNSKLSAIKTNVMEIRDTLGESIGDEIKPAVGIFEEIRNIAEEIKIGVESLLDPDNWRNMAESSGLMKSDIEKMSDSMQEVFQAADDMDVLTPGWFEMAKNFVFGGLTMKGLWDATKWVASALPNAFQLILGAAEWTLDRMQQIIDIGFKLTGMLFFAKTLIQTALKPVTATLGMVMTVLKKGGSMVGGLITKTVRLAGRGIMRLGKIANAAISVATGGVFKAISFAFGLIMKLIGPIMSVVGDFFKALMFVFEPFMMFFRIMLIPFIYRLLPIAVRMIAALIKMAADWVKENGPAIKAGVFQAWEFVKFVWAKLEPFREFLKNSVGVALDRFDKWTKGGWKKFFQDISYLFFDDPEAINKQIETSTKRFNSWLDRGWKGFFQDMSYLFFDDPDFLSNQWTKVSKTFDSWFKGGWNKFIGDISYLIFDDPKFLGKGIKKAWDSMVKAFVYWTTTGTWSKIWGDIQYLTSELWEDVKSAASKIFEWLWKKVTGIFDSVKTSLSNLGSKLKSGITGLVGLQEGGIVTQPTVALIGEAGPEAVVPLSPSAAPTSEAQNVAAFLGSVMAAMQRPDRAPGEGGIVAGATGTVATGGTPAERLVALMNEMRDLLSQIAENTENGDWVNDPDFNAQMDRNVWEM